MKKKYKYKIKKAKIQYAEKKSFLADKEIIFRSGGRAKVFNISHRLQVFVLMFLAAVICWSGYSYHFYHNSSKIIHRKEKELGKTRDAYMDLMTDVAALQNNLKNVVDTLDDAGNGLEKIKNYRQKAHDVEDKIKRIADSESWISQEKIDEQVTKKEALIQKDVMQKENEELHREFENFSAKLSMLQDTVRGLEAAEMAILDKISALSGQEIEDIKSSLSQINKSLKAQKLYFNPLSNVKKGQGGLYEPLPDINLNDALKDKISSTFDKIDTLLSYKTSMQKIPLGKPIFNYTLSSNYGGRSDPFRGKFAHHKGLDMSASIGTRVSARASGKVVAAEFQKNGYGNIVEIKHSNGFSTKYAHLNKIYVKKGDFVEYNQAIGEVGRTGRATGSHLHYEVLYKGRNVNPLTFVNIRSMNES